MIKKQNRIYLLVLLLTILSLSGCSQKVKVSSLKPALVDNQAIRKTAVLAFEHDEYGLREAVVSNMNKVEFSKKKYFSIVNRKDTQKILKEQKLQDSGLVNLNTFKQFGLSDVDSIITGNILLKDSSTSYYQKERYNYKRCLRYADDGKTCLQYQTYRIQCKQTHYNLSANITITDIQNSDVIFTNRYDKEYMQEKCSNEFARILSSHQVYSLLVKDVAKDFVNTIAPSRFSYDVEVIDDEDIDYDDIQEKYLENGLQLMELGDYKNANIVFSKLVHSTQYKSSVALYNLALSYEVLGDLERANTYYQKAKDITITQDMDKVIIKNAKRIENKIQQNNKALNQIKPN